MISIRAPVLLLLAASLGCAGPGPGTSPEAQRRIAELEKENAALRDQIDSVETRLRAVLEHSRISMTSCSWAPPIDAVLLDVKPDLNLVVLNKGKKDEVKVGYVFDVYLGATYKGQVRIQDVQEGMSSGLILHEINPIARGDLATTSL